MLVDELEVGEILDQFLFEELDVEPLLLGFSEGLEDLDLLDERVLVEVVGEVLVVNSEFIVGCEAVQGGVFEELKDEVGVVQG